MKGKANISLFLDAYPVLCLYTWLHGAKQYSGLGLLPCRVPESPSVLFFYCNSYFVSTTLRCIMLTIAHRILTLVLCIAGALANVSELQGRLEHAESALKRSLSVPAGQHTTSSPRTLLDVSPGGSRVDSFPASSTPVVMGRRETSSLRQPRR